MSDSSEPVPPVLITTPPPLPITEQRPSPALAPVQTSRLWQWLSAFWKLFLGMLFCQSLLGSFLVVGWTYRLAQRIALRQWWKRSAASHARESFSNVVNEANETRGHVTWPNWIVQQRCWALRHSRLRGDLSTQMPEVWRSLFGSLFLNLKLGIQGVSNTLVLTLPAGILWLFAWYDGWNNSFNKGYEQAAVGPLTGITGVIVFIAAMFYLPMAQMRQAVTGDWRSFYQFRIVWGLVRRRWLACLGLAMLYSLVALPFTVLKTAPAFLANNNPVMAAWTEVEAGAFLERYWFWAALYFFPAFVLLRIVAARIYASALLSQIQRGAMPEEALAETEWQALHRLDLLRVQPPPTRHLLVRLMAWAGSKTGRLVAGIITAFVWFTFVAQIFIGQFFHYYPGVGWLNQPLVQVPWLAYLPAHLKNLWGEIAFVAVLLSMGWLAVKSFRSIRRLF
jgi:hypothetical protein